MSEQSVSYYELLGGEVPLRNLVNTFYQIMDSDPVAKDIREQHLDLDSANEKLFLFLSGWMGGPSLYIEKYGHPRLRARHLPFSIGVKERDQWLYCMFKAMDICNVQDPFKSDFQRSLSHLADHMRNRQE